MSRRLGVGIAAVAALVVAGVLWTRSRKSGGEEQTSARGATSVAKVAARRAELHSLPRGSVAGVVSAKGGGPIAKAQVCAWARGEDVSRADRAEPRCATTDAAGGYVLDGLLATEHKLGASAPTFKPARYEAKGDRELIVEAGKRHAGVDFVLEPGGVEVRGKVKDIGGGGIAAALVRGRGAVARADSEGTFRLWARPGQVHLRASAPGYASSGTSVGAPTDTAEILLTPESILEGRVVLAETGQPVSGARVRVSGGRTVTDGQGRFRIDALGPGRYKPSAQSEGLYGESAESVMLSIGETRSGVLIKLHPMSMVRGRVMIEGKNQACQEPKVRLRGVTSSPWGGLRAKHAGNGTVELVAVPKGTYKVRVSCRGYVAKERYPELEVTGHHLTDLVWHVEEGGGIRVLVKSHEGKPLEGIRVAAHAKEGFAYNRNSREKSGADGVAELRGLRPGTYRVEARGSEHLSPEPKTVEVTNDEVARVELAMRQSGVVAGVVVDKKGAPQPGFSVWADGDSTWSEATTRSDGTFELRGVEPGKRTISARRGGRLYVRSKEARWGQKAKVAAGTTAKVRIVVDAHDGVISGKVVDSAGTAVSDAFVRAVAEGSGYYRSDEARARRSWEAKSVATGTDGAFELAGLGPGKYLVRAYRKGGGEAFKKHVEPGAEITLTIAKTVTLSGSVTTTSGDAVARFQIEVHESKTELEREETFFMTEGRWKISDLPAGKYTVRAIADEGEAKTTVSAAPGDRKERIDFRLEGRAVVEGYALLLGSNEPVARLRVLPVPTFDESGLSRAFGLRTTTDDKGFFRIRNAPPGKLLLMVWGDRSRYEGGLEVVDAAAGSTVTATIPVVPVLMKSGETRGDLGFAVKTPPGSMFRGGFQPFDVVVESVKPGGAADEAGLHKGDIITAVDGLDVTGYRAARYSLLFSQRIAKGRTLRFALKRGPTIAITAR